MERLAALVPPPRKNQVLYHGVLAPRAPMRLQAVVLPPATLRVLDGLEQACRGPPQQGAA
jgi:hypothetical protein